MNNKGFTLIEFMIVIAIIAVLAAMIVPNIINHENERRITVYEPKQSETTVITNQVERPGIITCLGGHKVINLNGKTYWIGNEPDTWGDLKALPCE